MNQKTIIPKHVSRRSGRVFQYYLPNHWIIRSQEDQEDYGVDFEVQITEKDADKATIDIFKIQLKGVEKESGLQLSDNKAKFSIEVEKLIHYQNLEIPIFLVLVCNENQRVFWVSLQGNKDIDVIIDNAIKKKYTTTTITLPNELYIQENFYDTSQLESKYQEVYHYLWNVKSRPFSDYSDDTLDKIDRICGNRLFDVIMERLYRTIENKDDAGCVFFQKEDIDRFVDIIRVCELSKISNFDEFKIIKNRINLLLREFKKLDEEEKLNQLSYDTYEVSILNYIYLYLGDPYPIYNNIQDSNSLIKEWTEKSLQIRIELEENIDILLEAANKKVDKDFDDWGKKRDERSLHVSYDDNLYLKTSEDE